MELDGENILPFLVILYRMLRSGTDDAARTVDVMYAVFLKNHMSFYKGTIPTVLGGQREPKLIQKLSQKNWPEVCTTQASYVS